MKSGPQQNSVASVFFKIYSPWALAETKKASV